MIENRVSPKSPVFRACRARWSPFLACFLLWLAGCAGDDGPRPGGAHTIAPPPHADDLRYAELPGSGIQCVPYARDRSGIGIFGDAYRWWTIADGYYMRARAPAIGAVLVLSKTSRLVHGHVAVVSAVLGPRQILVDHANWIPDKIILGMPVADVSMNNDWSLLRFWNSESQTFGAVYSADGFIYNPANLADDSSLISETITMLP